MRLATIRASTSVVPPAAAATTSVIGRLGKFCAAAACADKKTAAIAAITDLIIVSPMMPEGICPRYR
jgi:hypothetical protein